jgi:hypothetical protein
VSQRYRDVLDYEIGARIVVEFTTQGRDVVDYAVVRRSMTRTARR